METSNQNKEQFESKKRQKNGLKEFGVLLQDLEQLNSAIETNAADRSKNSLKKLLLAKRFTKIDEEILSLAKDRKTESVGEFFSDILLFEAKRLAFKEETHKCQNPNNPTQV